ncbi:MAG: LapA family protein [Nitrospirales bacterium]|nr:MAG: LapA family protein [Nitrospirales bacterium]
MATIIILLIALFLVSIFSVQNAVPVTITFLFWKFEASLAIVIFLCAVCGMIAGAIIVSLLRAKAPAKEVKNDTQVS